MSRAAPLVRAYVNAVSGRAIYVNGTSLKGSVAHFGFARNGLQTAAKLYFARPTHAELVMLRCVEDFKAVGAMRANGWVDVSPAEVIDKIKGTAALLGAHWQTQAAIERDAENVVADITRRVKEAQMDGELKQVNAEYKSYRQAQIEKSEPAIPYPAYMMNFIRLLVVKAAQKSMQ
jgi:hypothetical protein